MGPLIAAFETEYAWHMLQKHVVPQTYPHLCSFHHNGLKKLDFERERPPEISRLTDFVFRETGWELVRAMGEVPTAEFFAMLAAKKFPLVHELRETKSLFASSQPDFWHEIFGHLPALWTPLVSEIYQGMGRAGVRAARANNGAELARVGKFYWFICEYGLVLQDGALKLLGAGLVASPIGPLILKNPDARITPFCPEEVEAQNWNPYQFQGRLFTISDLNAAVTALERKGVLH